MTAVMLRKATAVDVAALERLVNSAFRGDSSRAGWTTEADLLDGQRVDAEGLAAAMAAPDNVILIAEGDNTSAKKTSDVVSKRPPRSFLIGCVHLQRRNGDCYLGMLTIRPAAQGTGLGSRLLDAAERWAATRWASETVTMTVIAQRAELIAWYERRGYRRTGEQRPFPYGNPRFGLPRRGDLIFVVLQKKLVSFER